MRRQRKSITQIAIDNLIFTPTKRSKSRKKPIPTESQVKTFDYVYGLLQSKWNRMRKTR
ncbi:NinE family protein [Salmonella enterica subsp. enterica serovar Meleagridis]|uniref:NinE family protein n=2 Tax=Salmonella enterica TaxID=28901 RepID=A0A623LFA7_SALER|nr:NinE family protein [Salmonella enterica]EAA0696586.1 NinE family protein [Salmonella enterica subsp. enterica serovar Nottingham]EBQ6115121.1 NinE family protein [Salmonella enterica subsp. enterica serovar Praha]EBV0042296.1 NinE family protein [Salmonella enterica subsp. enterica serovar Bonariensis]EBV5761951.1 NinE family protein [Salmonella enterica subsp. enterica serovar Hvittingfoss]ECF3708605.1 NinE family protein [Salmonella enterica subsp. enterica serovar Manhattan]ECT3043257.